MLSLHSSQIANVSDEGTLYPILKLRLKICKYFSYETVGPMLGCFYVLLYTVYAFEIQHYIGLIGISVPTIMDCVLYKYFDVFKNKS